MMVKAPLMSPEPPRPATALPRINMVDDVDAAHNTEPSSKKAMNPRKEYCVASSQNQNDNS